jgi:hypothetical protein
VASTTACDPATNTYELVFEVTFQGAPETGGLLVNGVAFASTTSPFVGALNLAANGTWVNLTASFADEPGCNYFLSNAHFGPESCGLQCPEDVNTNGIVDVSDVLGVLSDYGCEVMCNPASDINGDDAVTVTDILLLLSAFGNPC